MKVYILFDYDGDCLQFAGCVTNFEQLKESDYTIYEVECDSEFHDSEYYGLPVQKMKVIKE